MDPSKTGPIAPAVRIARAMARAATDDDRPRSRWADIVERDPEHSRRYAQRFRDLAAAGHDLVGEARLVDALAPRLAAILDAGCGPGRHAAWLHAAGHRVVGVDLDAHLVEVARAEAPGPTYLAGDLADLALPDDLPQSFDVILCAGNVMGFVHPATRRPILTRFAELLTADGRAVVGFGAGRGYAFDEFLADAAACGLTAQQTFSSWDLRPFREGSDFLVALLGRA